jgi:hypothetical protein
MATGKAAAKHEPIRINRAPVLTLWAAVVAERLGFAREEAATLGRAVAGMNAVSKGRRLGLIPAKQESPEAPTRRAKPAADDVVELLGRHVPIVHTKAGVRAAKGGKPDDPASVERYLASKFGESLAAARAAMAALAASFERDDLATRAFSLYEKFRPSVPAGEGGWGAKGKLDLALVRSLSRRR